MKVVSQEVFFHLFTYNMTLFLHVSHGVVSTRNKLLFFSWRMTCIRIQNTGTNLSSLQCCVSFLSDFRCHHVCKTKGFHSNNMNCWNHPVNFSSKYLYFKNGTVKDFYIIKFWLAGYLNLSLGRSWKLFWTTLSKKKQILILLREKKWSLVLCEFKTWLYQWQKVDQQHFVRPIPASWWQITMPTCSRLPSLLIFLHVMPRFVRKHLNWLEVGI